MAVRCMSTVDRGETSLPGKSGLGPTMCVHGKRSSGVGPPIRLRTIALVYRFRLMYTLAFAQRYKLPRAACHVCTHRGPPVPRVGAAPQQRRHHRRAAVRHHAAAAAAAVHGTAVAAPAAAAVAEHQDVTIAELRVGGARLNI